MENALKRMGELLPRLEAVRKVCLTCGYEKNGHCLVWKADIPAGALGESTCEKWDFNDIPF